MVVVAGTLVLVVGLLVVVVRTVVVAGDADVLSGVVRIAGAGAVVLVTGRRVVAVVDDGAFGAADPGLDLVGAPGNEAGGRVALPCAVELVYADVVLVVGLLVLFLTVVVVSGRVVLVARPPLVVRVVAGIVLVVTLPATVVVSARLVLVVSRRTTPVMFDLVIGVLVTGVLVTGLVVVDNEFSVAGTDAPFRPGPSVVGADVPGKETSPTPRLLPEPGLDLVGAPVNEAGGE